MDRLNNTTKMLKEKKEVYKRALVASIKKISMNSEGTGENTYPLITTLCELHQKLDEQNTEPKAD